MKITIVDYGAGNTTNVRNAFEKLGVATIVSDSERAWKNADALVLPGVGAFGSAMNKLGKKAELTKELLDEGKPFLGICLGMQLLMDSSEESPGTKGFGIIPGTVKRFRTDFLVPQIGWNEVKTVSSPLFDGLTDFYAYFVHSYYCEPLDSSYIAATTSYGITFASAFWKKNIFATQFHPEKSGAGGLKVLENFLKEVKS